MDDHHDIHSIGQSDHESEININVFNEQINELDIDESIPDDREEIETLIHRYIKLIRVDCTDEKTKRQLIVRLCELRIRLNALTEEEDEKYTRGHFLLDLNGVRACEVCQKKPKSQLIPPILSSSFSAPNPLLQCKFCAFSVHRNCSVYLERVRKCPRLLFREHQLPREAHKNNPLVILEICPEVGLYKQNFKCRECEQAITMENSHLCDYDGYRYCKELCYSGDTSIVPARVIHNWDFNPRQVSKRSFFLINYILQKPILFDVLQLNQMLYGFVDELSVVKQIRHELYLMGKYIKLCRQPDKPKLTVQRHLVEESLVNAYSINEFMDLPVLKKQLMEFHSELLNHITKQCESCKGNGFYCELCADKNDLLFPFLPNVSLCPKCCAVYHKNCFHRKKSCARCLRLEKKSKRNVGDVHSSDSDN